MNLNKHKRLERKDDPRYILMESSNRYVKIGTAYHASHLLQQENMHPYGILTNVITQNRKILASDELNDKQVKHIIKKMITDCLAFKTTDVKKEIKDIFGKTILEPIPEKKINTGKFKLCQKDKTDISESETDWSSAGFSRLKLTRQNGYYDRSVAMGYNQDSETEISD